MADAHAEDRQSGKQRSRRAVQLLPKKFLASSSSRFLEAPPPLRDLKGDPGAEAMGVFSGNGVNGKEFYVF